MNGISSVTSVYHRCPRRLTSIADPWPRRRGPRSPDRHNQCAVESARIDPTQNTCKSDKSVNTTSARITPVAHRRLVVEPKCAERSFAAPENARNGYTKRSPNRRAAFVRLTTRHTKHVHRPQASGGSVAQWPKCPHLRPLTPFAMVNIGSMLAATTGIATRALSCRSVSALFVRWSNRRSNACQSDARFVEVRRESLGCKPGQFAAD